MNVMGDASGDFPTTIGEDAVFKGELKFEKGVRLLGRFEGQIESKGQLTVAQGASLQGEVNAGDIHVDGEVKGNLHASGKVCLSASASLEGDLTTARLEVADGAAFVGRCVVGPNGVPKTAAPRPTVATKPVEAGKDKNVPQPVGKK
jgi:cytoskeletal protein CcmA (bactofilin family)